MKPYKFIKTGREWYIDLPEYLEQGGSIGDLQMVEGADNMLDMMAENNSSVLVFLAEEQFEGADMLTLTERCAPYKGGGYYLMKHYEGREINQTMWLCGVTEYVFGDLPEQIFVKRESNNSL